VKEQIPVAIEHASKEGLLEAELTLMAVSAMESWLPFVRGIPHSAHSPTHRHALENLVRWYQRVCDDTTYHEAPPVNGLDALVDEMISAPPYETLRWLGLGRWAIRVAEELVLWRASLAIEGRPTKVRFAADRLELALTTAIRHFNTEPPASSSSGFELVQRYSA